MMSNSNSILGFPHIIYCRKNNKYYDNLFKTKFLRFRNEIIISVLEFNKERHYDSYIKPCEV